jgi:predicted esterase
VISSLDSTGLLIFLSCLLTNSNSEITKDKTILWIAGADDAVFPAPLAMRARPIALVDQSFRISVRVERQTHFDSTSSTLYATSARLSSVDHEVCWSSA